MAYSKKHSVDGKAMQEMARKMARAGYDANEDYGYVLLKIREAFKEKFPDASNKVINTRMFNGIILCRNDLSVERRNAAQVPK